MFRPEVEHVTSFVEGDKYEATGLFLRLTAKYMDKKGENNNPSLTPAIVNVLGKHIHEEQHAKASIPAHGTDTHLESKPSQPEKPGEHDKHHKPLLSHKKNASKGSVAALNTLAVKADELAHIIK